MKVKNILRILIGTVLVLLIPLVAMQFTDEVEWTLSDFIVMGALLFITGTAIDLVTRKAGKYKAAAIGAVVVIFLWIWAELAVGVFTNWGS